MHNHMLRSLATDIPVQPSRAGRMRGLRIAVLRSLPHVGDSPSVCSGGSIAAVSSLLAIAMGEVVTVFISSGGGLLLHLAWTTLFLTLAAVLADHRWQAFFLALTLAPLIRVIDVAIPLGGVPQYFWLPLTVIPLLAAVVPIANMLDLSPSSIGLRPAFSAFVPLECMVAVSGIGLGVVEWLILRPAPIVGWGSIPLLLLVGALLLVCTGFVDVLLFQGFIQHAAGDLLGSTGGILFTAGVFSILHIGWKSPIELVFTFGAGLYFGVVRQRTGSVLGISLAHGVAVIMLFVVLPLRFTPQLVPQVLRSEEQVSGRWQTQGPASQFSILRPGLPAPILLRPHPGAAVPRGATTFCWSVVPGARGYWLKVAGKPRRRVRGTCVAVRLKLGIYQWRVRAFRDRAGQLTGRPTAFRRLTVGRPSSTAPPLAAAPPDVRGSPDLLAALALIVLLAVREITGSSTHQRMLRWRASLTIAIVPLLLVFAVIVTEKVIQVV